MKSNEKKLYLAMNQKMINIVREIDKLEKQEGTEEKIARLEKMYRATLKQANQFYTSLELVNLFET